MKKVVLLARTNIDFDIRTLKEAKLLKEAGLSVVIYGVRKDGTSLPLRSNGDITIVRVDRRPDFARQFRQAHARWFKRNKLLKLYHLLDDFLKTSDRFLQDHYLNCVLSFQLLRENADYYHVHQPLVLIFLSQFLILFKKGRFVFDYNDIVTSNLNSSASLSSEDYYEQGELWGGDLDEGEKKRLQETIEFIPAGVESILDLGCGDGRLTNQLYRHYPQVIGADISATALYYVKGEKVHTSSADLPFKDDSFDLVISTELIEHLPLPDFQKTIQEIKRISRRWILIGVPWQEQLALGRSHCANCDTYFHANYHYRNFHERTLSQLFFPEFKTVKKREIGMQRRYYSPFWLSVKQKIGGIYTRTPTTLCPNCGSNLLATGYPERSSISILCDQRNDRAMQGKEVGASHVVALYEKAKR